MTMLHRSCRLSVIMAALCMTAETESDEFEARPKEVPGWGQVLDPNRDCDFTLDREHDRLKIRVPATSHFLSAEVSQLPMNAPRVVRRVRGDFTADVHVLVQLKPERSETTHYDPDHGAGLIVWQDPSNYLRLERAIAFIDGQRYPYINYELREGGRLAVSRGLRTEDRAVFLKLRRQGEAFSAWYSLDGRRWAGLGRVDAAFAERIEVGVVAVNSSKQTMLAELERLNIEDPHGSMARDYRDRDSEEPSLPPSHQTE
jgi:regulation of enolase protein 1 (concanavalin A-like superfamily)